MGTSAKTEADSEFQAMIDIHKSLEPLDNEARNRVVGYIINRFEITAKVRKSVGNSASGDEEETEAESNPEDAETKKFSSFAELYDACQPSTNGDKALVAGYWFQICQNEEHFNGHGANTSLKNLGHGVVNITDAINNLKDRKPAHALQLHKSGKSKQSRKKYQITVAGCRRVEEMIKENNNG